MIAAAAVNAQMVIEIAKIYGVEITKDKAKNLAFSVGKILATMGLVKGGVSLITSFPLYRDCYIEVKYYLQLIPHLLHVRYLLIF